MLEAGKGFLALRKTGRSSMSLRISNAISVPQHLENRKLGKPKQSTAATAGVSLEKARKSASSPSRSSDPLRFELTNLNEQSISLQKRISSHQTTLSTLEDLASKVDELQTKPADSSAVQNGLQEMENLIDTSEFEGRSLLKGSGKSSSSNPDIEPVVVKDPPQIGKYKLSILGKVSNDSLQFRIEVADEPEFKKSMVTALSPATGIIEGVEVYFEEKEGTQEAELEIRSAEEGDFPVPDFQKSLENLKDSREVPEQLQREAEQTKRKIETTIDGVSQGLDQEISRFQNISNAQENIRAAVSEPRSVNSAIQALESLNTEIVKQSSNLVNLFNSSDTAKDLLE